MIIDVHAHVFPNKIANKASRSISDFYNISCVCSGGVEELIERNKNVGITKTIICSAAITPERVCDINDFIANTKLVYPNEFIGFGSIHPNMKNVESEVVRMKALGLAGIKVHPDFQRFMLDGKESMRMFEIANHYNMPFLIHVGDYRTEYSEPIKMQKVLNCIKNLKVICAHFGSWSIWEEGWKYFANYEGVWVDTSSSLYALNNKKAVDIINCFDKTRVLFGTDYPMWSPDIEVKRFLNLPISLEKKENILYKNAIAFLQQFNINL